MTSHIEKTIRDYISHNDVVLFMKGTKDFPQCGFSSHVTNILNELGVVFKDINVLEDDELRQGVKDFSRWPTLPQLYAYGEFIGGCDIVNELYEKGELIALLDSQA